MNDEMKRSREEECRLRRLPVWSWYIRGARDMLLMMRKHFLCEEPHGGDWKKVTADEKVINKAVIDMLLSDKLNIDRFLHEEYEIHLADHEKDKKGKLVKCRAYFARKVVRYEEVKD